MKVISFTQIQTLKNSSRRNIDIHIINIYYEAVRSFLISLFLKILLVKQKVPHPHKKENKIEISYSQQL